MSDLVHIENNNVFTTSLQVATTFEKEHKNVLRDIYNLISNLPNDFNQLNFQPVKYRDKKGEQRTYYNITRDGFSLLCMGFTGVKALQFKLAYINAFNEMERVATVEYQRLADQNAQLKAQTLNLNQDFKLIKALHDGGLANIEILNATTFSRSTLDKRLRTMRQLGLIDHSQNSIKHQPQQLSLGV